jgi:excisionase family DNA binding protein
MRDNTTWNTSPQPTDDRPPNQDAQQQRSPNRLMTVFEVAELVGCHEESVRRAYLCGQLRRHRFGVRSWRFMAVDVQDWIARGAPTRLS